MGLVYKPNHPQANDNGMIDRSMLYDGYERGEAPNVISDIMEPTRHMADGNYYTSKAQYRAATRAHGCIEYGNESATLLKPRKPIPLSREKRRDDIRRAFWEVKNGVQRKD